MGPLTEGSGPWHGLPVIVALPPTMVLQAEGGPGYLLPVPSNVTRRRRGKQRPGPQNGSQFSVMRAALTSLGDALAEDSDGKSGLPIPSSLPLSSHPIALSLSLQLRQVHSVSLFTSDYACSLGVLCPASLLNMVAMPEKCCRGPHIA